MARPIVALGAVAGSRERAGAVVEAELLHHRTADDRQRRGAGGGGLHAQQLERGIEHRLDGAVTMIGRYSGLQPAMTALMAIFSMVAMPSPGGTTPTTSLGARPR